MSPPDFLPYGRQSLDEDDIAAVTAVLRGSWLTTGPTIEAFEEQLKIATGAPHAVAVSSGTAALHLAALALGLGPGDWTIVPAMTFAATANAARFVGAEVQFADVDPDTGLMTAATLTAALDEAKRRGRRVRAVFPVHLTGQPVDLPAIAAIAAAAGAVVVEDACHALGGGYRGAAGAIRPVGDGGLSAIATFSFHPVKAIAVGEGGAVTTADEALAARCRRARSHGMVRDAAMMVRPELACDARGTLNPWYYEIQEIGFNYRLSDINAALGVSQMQKLARFIARRAELADLYDRLLLPLADRLRPVPRTPHGRSGWHLYAVLIDGERIGRSRADLMRGLAARGIGTQVHYIPVPWLPAYHGRPGTEIDPAGAARYYARELSLPLFPAMTDADARRVVDALAAETGDSPAPGVGSR